MSSSNSATRQNNSGLLLMRYALWGGYAIVKAKMFPNAPPEIFVLGIVVAAGGGIGALAALATLDFDFGTGAIHFAFYLLVSVLFCFIIGVRAY